jgi:hypothetical protein
MPHYDVKVMVEFRGDVHADSLEEAENWAMDNYSLDAGEQVSYYGVYSSKATKIDASEELDNCPADCEDVAEYEEENSDDAEVA